MKLEINMVGGGFRHDVCSSYKNVPKKIIWKKNNSANISFYIDHAIFSYPDKNKKNFAWLAESQTINTDLYRNVSQNINFIEENYEALFTHDEALLRLSSKFKFTICAARPWIEQPKITKKEKIVSMIASCKVMCREHMYRQQIINKYKNDLDLFGRGFNEILNKEEGLEKYYYSIAMENGIYATMFTEKIADCFAMGTIPIYYGHNSITNFFNKDGIIFLNDDFNLKHLTPELYYSKIDAVKDNFERIQAFPVAEDYIYERYLK
jgi:hypothetical protein